MNASAVVAAAITDALKRGAIAGVRQSVVDALMRTGRALIDDRHAQPDTDKGARHHVL